MKVSYKEVGFYIIALLLILNISLFLYATFFLPTPNQAKEGWTINHDLVRDTFIWVLFISQIIALISVFLKYKFNWLIISIPFFLSLFEIFFWGFKFYLYPFSSTFIYFMVLTGVNVLPIIYLFVKGIKKIQSLTWEIIFSSLIIIFTILLRFHIV
jgi:hypothetical protein